MKKSLLIAFAVIVANSVLANNIAIHNVSVTANNPASHFAMIKFDLTWDNSWRVVSGPSNWDAAWVFIKYRLKGTTTTWNHALLHYVDGSGPGDGHLPAAGSTISSSNDNAAGQANGVFIYRSAPGATGHVSYSGTELRWDYGANGVSSPDSVDIRIYGIEMVYVPQGSFSIGSGGSETDAFFTYPDTTQPYVVTSENAIPVGAVTNELFYHNNSGMGGDGLGPLPSSFPKGYNAFYCMKYEITQDEYAAFLNTLNSSLVINRSGDIRSSGNKNRMGLKQFTYDNVISTSPYVPCNYINWYDLAAFLDWAALRPITETEFEKAGRGTVVPTKNEFAWGTMSLVNFNPANQTVTANNPYTLSNMDQTDEGIATNYGNMGNAYWGYTSTYYVGNTAETAGPVRAGIFAANPGNTARITAGAGFYGIMELSGNITEMVVVVGVPDGRAFTGVHGDGNLTAAGDLDTPGWPFSTVLGVGVRGGSYADSYKRIMVSDRSRNNVGVGAPSQEMLTGRPTAGGRGVRTAP